MVPNLIMYEEGSTDQLIEHDCENEDGEEEKEDVCHDEVSTA